MSVKLYPWLFLSFNRGLLICDAFAPIACEQKYLMELSIHSLFCFDEDESKEYRFIYLFFNLAFSCFYVGNIVNFFFLSWMINLSSIVK